MKNLPTFVVLKKVKNTFHNIKHRLLYIPIGLLFLLSFVDCAKKGRPTGGALDTIPPVIVRASPENYTINFSSSEIKITFDEFIKLKDLRKNLLISPPLKYEPIITPLSTSKTLKIKLLDTLKENTTYLLNFGQSIVDNNEENPYPYYKYVFSTGTYIDSLKLRGSVRDIKLRNSVEPITLMLYELNEAFKDSLIYSEKPTYITTTKDSTATFEFTNLKEGEYVLLALQEQNNDYTFQPQTDKIGFINSPITLPTDSTFAINLYKEAPAYSLGNAKHETKQHIIFDYQGTIEVPEVAILSNTPADFNFRSFKDIRQDSLHYWFKPSIEADSLVFQVKGITTDTITVRMRNLFADSLKINALKTGNLKPRDTFKLNVNTPIETVDDKMISVFDKDTSAIDFQTLLNRNNNTVGVVFPRSEEQTYSLKLMPGAITDFFENVSDSLQYRVSTRLASDYGEISIQLTNAESFPMIVELVNEKFEVVDSRYLLENQPILFSHIDPGFYFIRITYDENQNKIWDSGKFLTRTQPEKIIYYPSKIEVRANWSLNETFILE